ncbi:hypothetical protein Hanom_Chr11g00988951 [Helianthus anomalus]
MSYHHALYHSVGYDIKLFLRRRNVAIVAEEADLYTESIKHFSKIINSRHRSPTHILTDCYKRVMVVLDEEVLEKQRKKVKHDELQQQCVEMVTMTNMNSDHIEKKNAFQGAFCRDIAVVGSLLCQTGFNRPIQVKYDGLSC